MFSKNVAKFLSALALWSFYIHSNISLFSCSVRYSNRKSNESKTNTFLQHSVSSLSVHSYSLLFIWPVR